MTDNWSQYEPYRPPYSGPLAQLSRGQAKESFEQWLTVRPERWTELQRLVGNEELTPALADSGVQELNDWFRRSVGANPEEPSRLANRWFAVVNDLSVVLGDILIHRCPWLTWEMQTRDGRRGVSYQRHVLTGFRNAPYPMFVVDVDRLVATYGHQVIGGIPVSEDYFVILLTEIQVCA
jgi:hypothetical protein